MKLLLPYLLGATFVAVPLLAVEACGAPEVLDGVLVPLSNLVGMGFVVWFARHTVVNTIPAMQEKYEESLQAAFAEARKAREEYHAELLMLADAQRQCSADHRAAIDKLTTSIMEMLQTCNVERVHERRA